ncbi:hemagglutinin-like secreted protein [plant metagenome]|uniref:Hemagglutinin-like secreted protein n=1 Tax=plant metagenome TaxID=1297885 RepID=A0A484S113_9ZZZZ
MGGGYTFGGDGGESAGQGGVGQDKHGNVAAGGNAKPASSVPSDKSGLSMGLPVALSASGSASSTTRSGISEGVIEIRDEAAQQALTGKSAAETIASLNRDTTDTLGALKPIFDKEKIEAGFEIGTAFAGEMGQFLTNRAREADALKAAMDRETDPERYRELQGQYEEKRQWLPGGTYRQLSNALLAAAGGNVGGATSEFAQRAVVSYLQQEGASKIGDLVAQRLIKEGSAEHVAWQAIIGCTGAVGSGDACGAGALGAGASVIVNSLLSDVSGLSNESKETRRNLVSALIVGAAGALDPAAAAALNNAAVADMDNNLLNPHRDHDLVALLARQDQLSPEQESALFERLKQAHATGTQEALMQMESVFGPEALGDTRQALVVLLTEGSACAAVSTCRLQLERSVSEIDRLLKAYETQKILTPKVEGAAIVAEIAFSFGGLAAITKNVLGISALRAGGETVEAEIFRRAADSLKGKAGTVFDSINATQSFYPGSVMPKSFEMSLPNGAKVWVHGNATEHFAEAAAAKAVTHTPEAVQLMTQQQLRSFQAAVDKVSQKGIPYDVRVTIDGWQLEFKPPRQQGGLPTIIHARYTGKN